MVGNTAINSAVPDFLRCAIRRHQPSFPEDEARSTASEKAAAINPFRPECIQRDAGGSQADFQAQAFEPERVPPHSRFRHREPRLTVPCPLYPTRDRGLTPPSVRGSGRSACRDYPRAKRSEWRLSLGYSSRLPRRSFWEKRYLR